MVKFTGNEKVVLVVSEMAIYEASGIDIKYARLVYQASGVDIYVKASVGVKLANKWPKIDNAALNVVVSRNIPAIALRRVLEGGTTVSIADKRKLEAQSKMKGLFD